MDKNRIIACGVLLTTALCATGLRLSTGETQARYHSSAAWYTVAEPAGSPVAGDCLADQAQPGLINLLGQLTREKQEIPITLTSEKNLSGPLTWTVGEPAYLKVGLYIGSRELENGDVIGLSAGKETTLLMTVEPTGQGLSLKEPTTVDIRVDWKNTLTGVFRAELPVEDHTAQTASQTAVQLETVEAFHPDTPLPIRLTGDPASRVQLGVGEDAPFPAGTRFSLDQGNSWYRLCREEKIPVDIPETGSASLLLDLSRTQLAKAQSITLRASDSQATLTANPTPPAQPDSRILTSQTPIRIRLTDAWPGCEFHYSVELLMAAQGTKAYVPVELSAGLLTAHYAVEEEGPVLTLGVGQTLPQPGTYRLKLSWSRDGICFCQSEIPFFVNYTQQKEGAQP